MSRRVPSIAVLGVAALLATVHPSRARMVHDLGAIPGAQDDGRVGEGSFYLVAVEGRGEAERFIAQDPYAVAGLISAMTLTRVRKGFFDGQRVPPARDAGTAG